jgi:HAD superfamily hydrolase (TIGR01509 family)
MLIRKDLRAEVIDGVIDVIQKFKGPRVVLTTQDAESANGILTIYELTSSFDDVVSAGGDDTRKSKVDSIRTLAKKHSVDLSDILWIEDASPEVHEGQNAGISVAIVRHPYNTTNVESADWIIER